MMTVISTIANCLLAIMAIVADVVSWNQLKSHKEKENNKLLSQLNKRYINNPDIQVVVRYLRVNNPDDIIPKPYQTELFLRFFEELGVYLRNNGLPKDDVINFFHYYFKRLHETERGQDLLKAINYYDEITDENEWVYLKNYIKAVGYQEL